MQSQLPCGTGGAGRMRRHEDCRLPMPAFKVPAGPRASEGLLIGPCPLLGHSMPAQTWLRVEPHPRTRTECPVGLFGSTRVVASVVQLARWPLAQPVPALGSPAFCAGAWPRYGARPGCFNWNALSRA